MAGSKKKKETKKSSEEVIEEAPTDEVGRRVSTRRPDDSKHRELG